MSQLKLSGQFLFQNNYDDDDGMKQMAIDTKMFICGHKINHLFMSLIFFLKFMCN